MWASSSGDCRVFARVIPQTRGIVTSWAAGPKVDLSLKANQGQKAISMNTNPQRRFLYLIAIVSVSVALLVMSACSQHGIPKMAQPYQPLPITFATADVIEVDEIYDGQMGSIPDSTWEKKWTREKMLSLLRYCRGLHSVPTSGRYDFQFSVLQQNGRVNGPNMTPPMYDYISKTGEIGEGHQWYYVPAEFRRGMLTIKAHLPKHKPSKVVNLSGATIIIPR